MNMTIMNMKMYPGMQGYYNPSIEKLYKINFFIN